MKIEIVIIIALVVYITVLHYYWHKKNLLFKEGIIRLMGLEEMLLKEGLEKMISKILDSQKTEKPKRDKIFDEPLQNFIFSDKSSQVIFLHYTKEEKVAQDITQQGFIFEDSFHKTAEQVTDDVEDFAYRHFLNRPFGPYVVVIGIEKELYEHLHNLVLKGVSELNVEQALSQRVEEDLEGNEELYLLPGYYIKGYVNAITGDIHINPDFNPAFNPHSTINAH